MAGSRRPARSGWLVVALLATAAAAAVAGTLTGGCRRDPADDRAAAARKAARKKLPAHQEHDDLAGAVAALVTPQTRLVGIGELHARVDRPAAPSTLAHFTAALLPALPARTSDLVLETWTVDPRCGKVAAQATAALQTATRRPDSTKNELGLLVSASRTRGLRAHAMQVRCEDYQAMAGGGDDAIVHMLDLTTSELARIANGLLRRPAPALRVPTPTPPSLVVVYGGAMHNDRFPTAGLEPWSYAAAVEGASDRTYLELDLITPELAADDPKLSTQPWAPLLGVSQRVVTYRRGERSYVVILPPAPPELPDHRRDAP